MDPREEQNAESRETLEQDGSSSVSTGSWSRPTIRRFGVEQTAITPISGSPQ